MFSLIGRLMFTYVCILLWLGVNYKVTECITEAVSYRLVLNDFSASVHWCRRGRFTTGVASPQSPSTCRVTGYLVCVGGGMVVVKAPVS